MGFRPGDSTTKQLLYIVNEIHQAFERPKSFVKPLIKCDMINVQTEAQ